MTDPLPIKPFSKPVNASVRLPGSKSITNRALIIAALADGRTLLDNCLFSEDTEIMINALIALGFDVSADQERKTISIIGLGGEIPNKHASLFVGNSGTSARFLTAFCCLQEGGEYILDGVEQMRKRPIKSLVDSLVDQGAEIDTVDGFMPITIRPNGLNGGEVSINSMSSSQFVSAIIMAAPYAKSQLTLKLEDTSLRRSYIDMTIAMLGQFGIKSENITASESSYIIKPQKPYRCKPRGYKIEGDASAASYFFALPLVIGGSIEIEGVTKNSLQGDTEFTTQIEAAGASIEWKDSSAICRFDKSKKPAAFNASFYAFSDTFLTAAALTPILDGPSKIEGIAHTRHQECDRIQAMATGLQQVGQNVSQEDGSLAVEPKPLFSSTIDTFHDHRVAMSFGILGCFDRDGDGTSWLKIQNPSCCKKTYPDFFQVLEQIRITSENHG